MVGGFELGQLLSRREITNKLMISIELSLILSFFLLLGPVIIMNRLFRVDVVRILVCSKGSLAISSCLVLYCCSRSREFFVCL